MKSLLLLTAFLSLLSMVGYGCNRSEDGTNEIQREEEVSERPVDMLDDNHGFEKRQNQTEYEVDKTPIEGDVD